MPEQDKPRDLPRLRGFLAQDGSNPFAEDQAPAGDQPASAEIFASPCSTKGKSYQPGDYETRMEHRGGRILGWGVASLLLALTAPLCWIGSRIPLATVPLALFCSMYCWYAATQDLRAMAAGVMDVRGRRKTRIARAVGQLSVVVTLGAIAVLLAQIFGLVG